MAREERVEQLLTTLADGVQVLSTLLTGHDPPRHVYRVLSAGGERMHEFRTLAEVSAFVLAWSGNHQAHPHHDGDTAGP